MSIFEQQLNYAAGMSPDSYAQQQVASPISEMNKFLLSAVQELSTPELRCDICYSKLDVEDNKMLKCLDCGVVVHPICYGLTGLNTKATNLKNWRCRYCTEWLSNKAACGERRCVLCPRKSGALVHTKEGLWVHSMCAIWIPETSLIDLQQAEGLSLVPKERFTSVTCKVCNYKEGACVQCSHQRCSRPFHASCARVVYMSLNLRDDVDTFHAYCLKHRNLAWDPCLCPEDPCPTETAEKSFYLLLAKNRRLMQELDSCLKEKSVWSLRFSKILFKEVYNTLLAIHPVITQMNSSSASFSFPPPPLDLQSLATAVECHYAAMQPQSSPIAGQTLMQNMLMMSDTLDPDMPMGQMPAIETQAIANAQMHGPMVSGGQLAAQMGGPMGSQSPLGNQQAMGNPMGNQMIGMMQQMGMGNNWDQFVSNSQQQQQMMMDRSGSNPNMYNYYSDEQLVFEPYDEMMMAQMPQMQHLMGGDFDQTPSFDQTAATFPNSYDSTPQADYSFEQVKNDGDAEMYKEEFKEEKPDVYGTEPIPSWIEKKEEESEQDIEIPADDGDGDGRQDGW
eukprot:Platyproteum_vivax@DN5263_c0_g1_i1.p1